MLNVTVPARDRLSFKLSSRKAAEDVAMRVTRKPGGWRLRPDHARPADTAITHEGRIVLLLDEQVSRRMTRRTLDVVETDAGPRLTLR